MAGKYGIGARVRDEDGDEGVVVGKRKGERLVAYDGMLSGFESWRSKSSITPIAANDDTPAPAEQEQGEPAEAEFKVGDRVRNIGESGYSTCFPLGATGTVVSVGEGTVHAARDSDDGDGWCFYPRELELVTPDWQPKVGDRVRVTYGHGWDGEGVVEAEHAWIGNFSVRMPDGRLGAFPTSCLEPLPVAAEAQGANDAPAGAVRIQAGKFYRTRDGRKVLVRKNEYGNTTFPWAHDCGAGSYHALDADGKSCINSDEYDLVAEWADEPKAGVTAIFDELEAWLGEDNPVAVPPVAVTPATATPIKKRDLVTLARPAMVTGFDPNNPAYAHVVLGTGGAYTLPVAALVAA